jgi:hypothetical protein
MSRELLNWLLLGEGTNARRLGSASVQLQPDHGIMLPVVSLELQRDSSLPAGDRYHRRRPGSCRIAFISIASASQHRESCSIKTNYRRIARCVQHLLAENSPIQPVGIIHPSWLRYVQFQHQCNEAHTSFSAFLICYAMANVIIVNSLYCFVLTSEKIWFWRKFYICFIQHEVNQW